MRIPIPQLTEERRKEIAKSLKKLVEEAKIGVRQARKDANDDIKNEFKKKSITEDDVKKFEKDIQKVTDEFIVKIDERFSKKEKEILTV